MKYNTPVAPEAIEKLNSHVEFLAKASENAAVRLYKNYIKSLEELSENPKMYPKYKHPENDNLKYKLFEKRYKLVFEIIGTDVYIYDIQDCRQDTDKNLI